MERAINMPQGTAPSAEHAVVEIDGLRVPRDALRRAADLIASWEGEGSYDAADEAIQIYRIIRNAVAAAPDVTPSMLEAGIAALDDLEGEVSRGALASAVYQAMALAEDRMGQAEISGNA